MALSAKAVTLPTGLSLRYSYASRTLDNENISARCGIKHMLWSSLQNACTELSYFPGGRGDDI